MTKRRRIVLSALSYRKIGELLLDSSKLTFVAVLVTSNLDDKSLSASFFLTAILGAVACLVLGLASINKAAALEQQEQMSHSSRHRKHRIRIPKNTTIGVEVEE